MRKELKMRLPNGLKDILPGEAEKISLAEDIILSTFKEHGFKRVVPPLIEYIDAISVGLDRNLKDRVFKFIEPQSGRVVAIAPDITPQIARIVASRMRDFSLPIKLCYNKSVLRLNEPAIGLSREILQIGAEYLTRERSPGIDAEIIILAMEVLKAVGLRDFKIDIGDVGFVRSIIDNISIKDNERRMIWRGIALKDTSTLKRMLKDLEVDINRDVMELIISIPTLFGGAEVLNKAQSLVNEPKAREAVNNLAMVIKTIDKEGWMDFVTIDLGEVRGFDYYTGIIFEAFASGMGKSILSGGRYDNLMAKYAYPCNAVGFAFDLENLITAMNGGY